MPYKPLSAPDAPPGLDYVWTGDTEVTLSWSPPATSAPRRYAVYRIRSDMPPDVDQASRDAVNLLAVTGDTTLVDYPGEAPDPYYYFVRSVSRNSIESDATMPVQVYGRATSVRNQTPAVVSHLSNYPNPFTEATRIEFGLEQNAEVTLRIYNAQGAAISSVLERRFLHAGSHRYVWAGTGASGQPLSSGPYYVVIDVDGARFVQPVVLVR